MSAAPFFPVAGAAPLAETVARVETPIRVEPETTTTLALVDGPARQGRPGPYAVLVSFEGRPAAPDVSVELALYRIGHKGPGMPEAPRRFMRLELGPGPELLVWSWLDEAEALDAPVYRVTAHTRGGGAFVVGAGVVKAQLLPEGSAAPTPFVHKGPARPADAGDGSH